MSSSAHTASSRTASPAGVTLKSARLFNDLSWPADIEDESSAYPVTPQLRICIGELRQCLQATRFFRPQKTAVQTDVLALLDNWAFWFVRRLLVSVYYLLESWWVHVDALMSYEVYLLALSEDYSRDSIPAFFVPSMWLSLFAQLRLCIDRETWFFPGSLKFGDSLLGSYPGLAWMHCPSEWKNFSELSRLMGERSKPTAAVVHLGGMDDPESDWEPSDSDSSDSGYFEECADDSGLEDMVGPQPLQAKGGSSSTKAAAAGASDPASSQSDTSDDDDDDDDEGLGGQGGAAGSGGGGDDGDDRRPPKKGKKVEVEEDTSDEDEDAEGSSDEEDQPMEEADGSKATRAAKRKAVDEDEAEADEDEDNEQADEGETAEATEAERRRKIKEGKRKATTEKSGGGKSRKEKAAATSKTQKQGVAGSGTGKKRKQPTDETADDQRTAQPPLKTRRTLVSSPLPTAQVVGQQPAKPAATAKTAKTAKPAQPAKPAKATASPYSSDGDGPEAQIVTVGGVNRLISFHRTVGKYKQNEMPQSDVERQRAKYCERCHEKRYECTYDREGLKANNITCDQCNQQSKSCSNRTQVLGVRDNGQRGGNYGGPNTGGRQRSKSTKPNTTGKSDVEMEDKSTKRAPAQRKKKLFNTVPIATATKPKSTSQAESVQKESVKPASKKRVRMEDPLPPASAKKQKTKQSPATINSDSDSDEDAEATTAQAANKPSGGKRVNPPKPASKTASTKSVQPVVGPATKSTAKPPQTAEPTKEALKSTQPKVKRPPGTRLEPHTPGSQTMESVTITSPVTPPRLGPKPVSPVAKGKGKGKGKEVTEPPKKPANAKKQKKPNAPLPEAERVSRSPPMESDAAMEVDAQPATSQEQRALDELSRQTALRLVAEDAGAREMGLTPIPASQVASSSRVTLEQLPEPAWAESHRNDLRSLIEVSVRNGNDVRSLLQFFVNGGLNIAPAPPAPQAAHPPINAPATLAPAENAARPSQPPQPQQVPTNEGMADTPDKETAGSQPPSRMRSDSGGKDQMVVEYFRSNRLERPPPTGVPMTGGTTPERLAGVFPRPILATSTVERIVQATLNENRNHMSDIAITLDENAQNVVELHKEFQKLETKLDTRCDETWDQAVGINSRREEDKIEYAKIHNQLARDIKGQEAATRSAIASAKQDVLETVSKQTASLATDTLAECQKKVDKLASGPVQLNSEKVSGLRSDLQAALSDLEAIRKYRQETDDRLKLSAAATEQLTRQMKKLQGLGQSVKEQDDRIKQLESNSNEHKVILESTVKEQRLSSAQMTNIARQWEQQAANELQRIKEQKELVAEQQRQADVLAQQQVILDSLTRGASSQIAPPAPPAQTASPTTPAQPPSASQPIVDPSPVALADPTAEPAVGGTVPPDSAGSPVAGGLDGSESGSDLTSVQDIPSPHERPDSPEPIPARARNLPPPPRQLNPRGVAKKSYRQ